MNVFDHLGNPAQATNVRRLSQRSFPYLQALIRELTLVRKGEGLQLKLKIDEDPLTIISGQGKADLEAQSRAAGTDARDQLQQRIDALRDDENLMGYRLNCSDWPLRHANGGVLPVVHFEGEDHFLLFYRDIFPAGWNIANGASDDVSEWVDPTLIVHREFGEEVLITDPQHKVLYVYSPPMAKGPVDFHHEAMAAWQTLRPEFADYKIVPMPFMWIDGPDSVRVEFGSEVRESSGLFLSVTPEDHGIEVDKFVLIRLPDNASFLDGEVGNGIPFNHVVGLFSVKRLESIYDGREFLPDHIFFNGELSDKTALDSVVKQYLAHVRKSATGHTPLRSPNQIKYYDTLTERFNFCPISRSIIGKYYRWLADSGRQEVAANFTLVEQPETKRRLHDSEVFVSHSSRQEDIARSLYDFLVAEIPNHDVFLSAVTLQRLGESNYRQAIEAALEAARCLIVVVMSLDDLNSGWLNYEWLTFQSEVISGRKQGRIFVLLNSDEVKIADLPLGLRQCEVIIFSQQSEYDSYARLTGFLKGALESLGEERPRTR